MESLETWEKIVLAGMALALILLLRPGLKGAFRQSQQGPKDWMGLLVPLVFVVLFVAILILLA
ncbi:MAG: hypothetical protein OEQ18_04340 [Gammaproteobacteria bacterium]|nr:hypothetical protein [Gammaproteobacteria bacterium]